MELRHLHYFAVVAEELHFGRAAARLQMTQPPLSQQIQQLEEELGVTLFQRTKRRVELTKAGEVFLAEIKQALVQINQAVENTQRAQRGEFGRLSVGFVGSAMYEVLPPIIREYRKQFPGVSIDLYELPTPEQVDALHGGRIDVGLLRPPVLSDLIETEVIQHKSCMLCLPKGHPLAEKDKVEIQDLRDEPFIVVSRSTLPGLFGDFLSMCQNAGFTPRIVQETAEYQTVIGLVSTGIGISIVPSGAKNFYHSEVVYKNLYGANLHVELAVAFRKNDSSREVEEFLRMTHRLKEK
jgi:DNA-binding transcriptional LysR family regulator